MTGHANQVLFGPLMSTSITNSDASLGACRFYFDTKFNSQHRLSLSFAESGPSGVSSIQTTKADMDVRLHTFHGFFPIVHPLHANTAITPWQALARAVYISIAKARVRGYIESAIEVVLRTGDTRNQ